MGRAMCGKQNSTACDSNVAFDETELHAAEWVARLDAGPLEAGERDSFRQWLEEDPDHLAAFEEASATWRELAVLRQSPGPLRARLPVRQRRLRMRKVAGLGAVAGLCLMLAGAVAYNQFGNPMLFITADYRTGPGELRQVQLPDGSTVELGPSTALALDYSADERRVRLLAGEAYFTALARQKAQGRPFVVAAAGGATRALGTQFVVGLQEAGAEVLAVEHQVEVSFGDMPSVVLSPGEEVHYVAGAGAGAVQTRDLASATAWRRGLLVFDDMPLRDVVATLNRYRRGRIVILDSSIGDRRVSGVFSTSDLNDVIETVTAELGLGARSVYPFITVLY